LQICPDFGEVHVLGLRGYTWHHEGICFADTTDRAIIAGNAVYAYAVAVDRERTKATPKGLDLGFFVCLGLLRIRQNAKIPF
jgi:hypothetical protein